jgi:L-ascorbate metabolism protein UlaG (beta-lactamase superfamily)
MKRSLAYFLLISVLLAGVAGCAPAATAAPTVTPLPPTVTPVPATPTPFTQDVISKLHWFGTSAFLYKGSKVIYFDPVTLDGTLPAADLILVTHAHSDHWSAADIKKVIGPNTTLIISPNISANYEASKSDLGIPATILAEGQTTEVNGARIQAVPAYNAGHPREAGGVGYLVTIDGVRLYMSGGTDSYPEMAQNTCDIAFLTVYSKAQAQTMAEIIPAKTFIFEHTSYYAAMALANLFTKDIGGGKTFIAMEAGPNSP